MGKKSKKKQSPSSAATTASSSALEASSGTFAIGDRILLGGLKTKKYNGKYGVVKSLPNANEGRHGILLDGMTAPVAIRLCNISHASSGSGESIRKKSTQEQLAEKKLGTSHLEPSKDCPDADQLRQFRTMMNMFMTEEVQINMYGRKIDPVPDFLAELVDGGGGFPVDVDQRWAEKYIRKSFEDASGLPHYFEAFFKQPSWTPEPRYVFKRLNSTEKEKLDWYMYKAVPGSIFQQRVCRPYSSLMRHSFSNQAYRKEVLHRATTHVAVGFVDLGMLFAADLQPGPTGKSGHPMRFIGVEMSAYVVAKAHVIWELLQMTPPQASSEWKPHLCQVLQVWFSSTWEKETFEAVQKALIILCSKDSTSYYPDVRELLEYWLGAPKLPLRKARSQIKQATTDSLSEIGQLLQKRDRTALARYELTRDFALQGQPLCGNTPMLDCPDGTPPLENDETVFAAFSWMEIMKIRLEHERSGMDILMAAERYALAGVEKLAKWAANGSVTVELKCAAIQDVIHEVAEVRPWTMSWSNILDYLDYREFHRIARACSIHGDTIHYAYSMNWSTEVMGVSIVDYPGKERAEIRAELLDSANDAVERFYMCFGWDRHLRCPPPTNPLNTSSQFCLEQLHFRAWARCFFDVARREGHLNVANIEHSVGSPLSSTGGSTVAFTWSYDPDIRFNNMHPMLASPGLIHSLF